MSTLASPSKRLFALNPYSDNRQHTVEHGKRAQCLKRHRSRLDCDGLCTTSRANSGEGLEPRTQEDRVSSGFTLSHCEPSPPFGLIRNVLSSQDRPHTQAYGPIGNIPSQMKLPPNYEPLTRDFAAMKLEKRHSYTHSDELPPRAILNQRPQWPKAATGTADQAPRQRLYRATVRMQSRQIALPKRRFRSRKPILACSASPVHPAQPINGDEF